LLFGGAEMNGPAKTLRRIAEARGLTFLVADHGGVETRLHVPQGPSARVFAPPQGAIPT
jgi:hypothetical protein